MKNYIRLLTRVTDTPLFISQDKLSLISENVLCRIAAGIAPNTEWDTSQKIQARTEVSQRAKGANAVSANDIAIIDVYDSLAARGFVGMSGGTTYESIRAELSRAATEGYKNIMLFIDSPGGEVTGLFALTHYMRELQTQGITLTSFIDGSATSAAFAIAAATKERYITPTSLTGSIGAIMVHLETSIADAASGKTYTIFRSKPQKALGDSHTPLTEEVVNKYESLLAKMDAAFNNDVLTSMPNLTLQTLIDMQGSEFIAEEALSLGLVTAIVPSVDSAIKMALQAGSTSAGKQKNKTTLSTIPKGIIMESEELQTMLSSTQAELIKVKAELATAIPAAIQAERERVLSVLEATKVLHLSMDTAISHITKGYDAEASLEIQTAIAEGLGKSVDLQGAGNHTTIDPDIESKVNADKDKVSALRVGARAAGFKFRSETGAL